MHCVKGCKLHPGVYLWRNTISGTCYIGSSANCVYRRKYSHRRALRRGLHKSKHWLAAWIKYGEAAFKFSVVCKCEPALAYVYEQLCIDSALEQGVRLYNKRYKVASYDAAIAEKCKEALAGRKFTDEHKAKISNALRGKKKSSKHVENNAAAHRGKKKSLEYCAKLKASKSTPEFRARMSEVHSGKKLSAETKAKLSVASKGRKRSDATKQKMQKSLVLA